MGSLPLDSGLCPPRHLTPQAHLSHGVHDTVTCLTIEPTSEGEGVWPQKLWDYGCFFCFVILWYKVLAEVLAEGRC